MKFILHVLSLLLLLVLTWSTEVGRSGRIGCVDYQEEITTEWCVDNGDLPAYMNICDGSKEDCVAKGKAKCLTDNDCYGIMYNGASWGPHFKGVKVCTSRKLAQKGDWKTFLKCSSGNLLKKLGESCGSCFCPPTFTAGECEQGLDCVSDPLLPDAGGKCDWPTLAWPSPPWRPHGR
jgi:hypothetical protein